MMLWLAWACRIRMRTGDIVRVKCSIRNSIEVKFRTAEEAGEVLDIR